MVAVPIDVETLAADKRASIAAHHLALLLHDARERGTAIPKAELEGWYVRWHHATMRVAEHGPNSEGQVVIVNGSTGVDAKAAGIAITSKTGEEN